VLEHPLNTPPFPGVVIKRPTPNSGLKFLQKPPQGCIFFGPAQKNFGPTLSRVTVPLPPQGDVFYKPLSNNPCGKALMGAPILNPPFLSQKECPFPKNCRHTSGHLIILQIREFPINLGRKWGKKIFWFPILKKSPTIGPF